MKGSALVIAGLAALAMVWAAGCGDPAPAARAGSPPAQEWRRYGGDAGGTRYSPLSQVNRQNVQQLREVWTYDSKEKGGLETQPIVVDRVLYALTPKHEAIALDATTGRRLWIFDSGLESTGPNRGVTYWRGGDDERLFVAVDQFLYALNARTGKPVPQFGEHGHIDLRSDLGRDPRAQSVRLTSPGVAYKDLIIIGGRVSESQGASPGDVRAYDARSGRLRWSFHTIPYAGEFGADTWPPNARSYSGGANNWAGMVIDEQRGMLFVPTGSAAADHYGADRIGDDLFANCLLALNADTGERIWHFQVVHHDLWDRDLPAPPSLVTVKRDGRTVDAVVQVTKQGFVFLFDRVTGSSMFPVEERPFPASTVEGERAAATQPVPLKPAPFVRQLLSQEMLTNRTPEAHAAALDQFKRFRNGQFQPFSVNQETILFPGFNGGAEWGGAAVDPATGVLYVNASEMAWTGMLAPTERPTTARGVYLSRCAVCHGDDLRGAPPQIPALLGLTNRASASQLTTTIRAGAGRMPSFQDLTAQELAALDDYLLTGRDRDVAASQRPTDDGFISTAKAAMKKLLGFDSVRPMGSADTTMKFRFTGYKKFLDIDGYPAIAPPWGTLSAIDLNSGTFLWQVPLGKYPALASRGITDTGSENYGGPIVTAGGLVFIAATSYDNMFRAFDKDTGKLVWQASLPFPGNATPISYEADGRQFIVIAAGGNSTDVSQSGGVYVAFALP